jgi:hypothetical protein
MYSKELLFVHFLLGVHFELPVFNETSSPTVAHMRITDKQILLTMNAGFWARL